MQNTNKKLTRTQLEERAKRIKLLIMDVDGVMTDGRLYISDHGEQLKVFNTLDGHGIKMLRASGVEVAIISGRKSGALRNRSTALGISYLFEDREDKLNALSELLAQTGVTAEQTAHIGDDLPDLPVMLAVGLGIAVPNAHPLVRERANWCTGATGGSGAVREVCDLIMQAQGTLEHTLAPYIGSD